MKTCKPRELAAAAMPAPMGFGSLRSTEVRTFLLNRVRTAMEKDKLTRWFTGSVTTLKRRIRFDQSRMELSGRINTMFCHGMNIK